jgi:hypothetical protein
LRGFRRDEVSAELRWRFLHAEVCVPLGRALLQGDFKETIAAYSGRADKRVEVPCTTTCPQHK